MDVLNHSVVIKQELSNTAKLSVFKLVFFILGGHESLVIAKSILSQVQVAEMGFLRRVYTATLRGKVHAAVKFVRPCVTTRVEKNLFFFKKNNLPAFLGLKKIFFVFF